MDILATRRGGFTGLTEQPGPVKVGELPRAAAGRIGEIVAKANLFELPGGLGGAPTPDGFTYGMTVVQGDRRHEISWNDWSQTPTLPICKKSSR